MARQSLRQLPATATMTLKPKWPWPLWGKWIIANALAELVGLGTSSLLWALYFLGWEERLGTLLAASLVVLGSTVLEGSAVGVAQWWVLRHRLPKLTLRAWWIATALGAFIAWTLGMLPSTLMSMNAETTGSAPPEISDALMYTLATGMGLVLGPILAIPQWWVLRQQLHKAWYWIPANAFAWAFGMPVIFMVMGTISAFNGWTILLLLTGLAVAGAVVGLIHGLVLIHLLATTAQRMPQSVTQRDEK